MKVLLRLRFSSLRHRGPLPILAILFRPFGLLACKTYKIIWLSYLSILSVPDEGYSRNALCALNLISTFYSIVATFCTASCLIKHYKFLYFPFIWSITSGTLRNSSRALQVCNLNLGIFLVLTLLLH
jgi:hypothetical protein